MKWLADTVRFRNAATLDVIRDVPLGVTPIHGLFSSDGTQFYVDLQSSNELGKITVSSGSVITQDLGHPPFNITLSESGTTVYVTTADGWVFGLDATTLAKVDSVPIFGASNGIAVRNGKLWVSTLGGTLYKLNPATLARQDSVVIGGAIQRIALNSDASKLYAANEVNGVLEVVTTATHAVTHVPLAATAMPVGLALTPDGSQVWLASRTDGFIYQFSTATLDSAGTLEVGGIPRDITFAQNGAYVLIGAQNYSVMFLR